MIFVNILVRKNVYKDVWSFENVFNFVRCLKVYVFVFENSKDVCFEMEQVIRSILPTQNSFLYISFSFDIVILPLIW